MENKQGKDRQTSRRKFIQTTGSGTLGLGLWAAAAPWMKAAEQMAPSDRIRVGVLGFGVRGQQLAWAVGRGLGAEVVAVCDVYDGRFRRAAERLDADKVEMTKDYRRLLDRKDIDAVIIATPDHWHMQMTIDALEAGKDVYLEKPMAHTIEEGKSIVESVNRTGRVLQAGSQLLSSVHLHELKEAIAEGRLGKITQVKAWWDTGSLIGAWVKPVPPDASPETIDWKAFLGPAPYREFEPERVFRWRCYSDYSEGLAGDVLSHLITEIHWLLDLDMPTRVAATGGIFHWNDGRDVADTVSAVCQYPEGIALTIGATQANGYGDQIVRLLGTEGTVELTHSGWTLYEERYPEGYPYVIEAWPREFREEFYREHNLPLEPQRTPPVPQRTLASFTVPSGYASTREHVKNFFHYVRTREEPLENAVLGHKAAAVAHLINLSLQQEKTIYWDRIEGSIIS
jgi:predicted dehydrogenase